MRIANATAALLLGIVLSPAIALAQEPPVLPAELFQLTGRVGILGYTYSENLGDIESDYTTVGPAWGVTATVRLLERVELAGDELGRKHVAADGFTRKNHDDFFAVHC